VFSRIDSIAVGYDRIISQLAYSGCLPGRVWGLWQECGAEAGKRAFSRGVVMRWVVCGGTS